MKILKKSLFSTLFFLFLAVFWYLIYPIFIDKNPLELPWRILILDKNSEIITDKPTQFWYNIPLQNKEKLLGSRFVKDLLFIEDKRFYTHLWIDFLSKIRAFHLNLFSWKILSWWSTITEQYIKNYYFPLEKRDYFQKIREAFLSFFLTIYFSKDEILLKYLDNLYFWNNLYWFQSAIEVYFWKENPESLSEKEIVFLISLIKYPWFTNLENPLFKGYFNIVKQRLWYDFEDDDLTLNRFNQVEFSPVLTNRILKEKPYKKWEIYKTTLDKKLLDYSDKIIKKELAKLQKNNANYVSLLAFNPDNWEVLSYIWNSSFKYESEVDMISSKRQTGSTLKPFLYLFWLKNWASSTDFLVDIKTSFSWVWWWKKYTSNNYSLREYGLVEYKKAIWNSFNNSTVRLADKIWLSKVFDFFIENWLKFDKTFDFYWYSFILWWAEQSLENLALSYVNLIPDSLWWDKYNLNFFPSDSSFLGGEIDWDKIILEDILKSPENRDISFWANSILNTDILQAVKTWTTSFFRDNYVISYSKDLIVLVWVWNLDASSMKWVTWISWAWKIWRNFIQKTISLWYIEKFEYPLPDWYNKGYYCLDESCFMKQKHIFKDGDSTKSFPNDKIFSKSDIFDEINFTEEEYLRKLWFFIQN